MPLARIKKGGENINCRTESYLGEVNSRLPKCGWVQGASDTVWARQVSG